MNDMYAFMETCAKEYNDSVIRAEEERRTAEKNRKSVMEQRRKAIQKAAIQAVPEIARDGLVMDLVDLGKYAISQDALILFPYCVPVKVYLHHSERVNDEPVLYVVNYQVTIPHYNGELETKNFKPEEFRLAVGAARYAEGARIAAGITEKEFKCQEETGTAMYLQQEEDGDEEYYEEDVPEELQGEEIGKILTRLSAIEYNLDETVGLSIADRLTKAEKWDGLVMADVALLTARVQSLEEEKCGSRIDELEALTCDLDNLVTAMSAGRINSLTARVDDLENLITGISVTAAKSAETAHKERNNLKDSISKYEYSIKSLITRVQSLEEEALRNMAAQSKGYDSGFVDGINWGAERIKELQAQYAELAERLQGHIEES